MPPHTVCSNEEGSGLSVPQQHCRARTRRPSGASLPWICTAEGAPIAVKVLHLNTSRWRWDNTDGEEVFSTSAK